MSERQIFEHALELTDPVRREQFLSQACGADQELRGRIDALLATHDEQSRFLETPAAKQIQTPPDTSGEATVHLPAGSTEDLDDGDDSTPPIDLSFLKPSTKPGSIGLLGHYEILKVLGQGAFGIVFKAFDEKLQRHVAIKTMNVQMAATSPPRKRFLREARAAAAIRHDNVTQVYSVEEEPIPYLVMEYIDGTTLSGKLDAVGPLEIPEMLHLGRQIALGLAAAHEQSLVHRDIKPGNILLEKGAEQKVKITDFGLARAADDASLTQSGLIAGTPLYMAPEQALGQALDARTDLFSFGSVLYQMAAGHPPFRAPTTVAVLRRVVDDTQRPLKEIIPEIPDWFVSIVNKLLAKKPDDRYQSAREVADLLTRCQSELQLAGEVTCVPGAGSVSARSTPNETIITDRSRIRQNSAEPVVDGRSLTTSTTTPNAKKPPLKTVLYALFLAFLMLSPILFGRHLSRLTSSWFFGSIPTLPVVGRAAGLRFDGEGDFVQVPVSWDHPQFTIEAFVTPEEAGPHRTVVELTNYGSGTKDERLELYDAVGGKGERLSFAAVTGGNGRLNAYGPQTPGVREHRAIVCDGQEIHYYINGIWQGKRNNQPQDNQLWRMRWLTIGCQLGEKNFFKGEIDQLRVSKVARYTDNFPAVSLVESDDATLALYNFEEGTGDLLKDMSGNGHDAKISGATWIHPAKGLLFDGVDDYVEFTGLGWNSSQYTIEAYISQDGGHGNLFQTAGTGGMLHMYLYPQGGGTGINRAQVYANANGPRKGKTRQHLAVVYDGQNLNYFVQGQLAGVKTNVSAAATPMPLDRMTIGSKLQTDPSKPEFFGGRLEQLRVSNKVRYVLPFQPGELKTDDETLALYDFTTGEGEVIKDSCGKSPDGKIVGATWVRSHRDGSHLTDGPSRGSATASAAPTLEPAWVSLMDRTGSWQSLSGFSIEDGLLVGRKWNQAISKEQYVDFELVADWRMKKGADCAICYRMGDSMTGGNLFTLVDDETFTGQRNNATQWTGSQYGVVPPLNKKVFPPDEWHTLRILCKGTRIQHWIDDDLQVDCDTADQVWKDAVANSFITWKDKVGLPRGYLRLQVTDGEIAFRDLRIRRLDPLEPSSTLKSSPSRRVLQFDGVDDYVHIPSLAFSEVPLTVEAWITPQASNDHGYIFGWAGDFAVDVSPQFKPRVQVFPQEGKEVPTLSGSSLRPNVTQHIAVVLEKDGFTLFQDGQPFPRNSQVQSLHLQRVEYKREDHFAFGAQIGPYSSPSRILNHFHGVINSCRLSRGSLYSGPFTPAALTKTGDTLALYDFAQGSGDVLKDISGNGHDGKIVGAQWVKDGAAPSPEGSHPQLAEILTSPDYEWTTPEKLGPEVNSAGHDAFPRVSADGKRMWFQRVDGAWISERQAPGLPWQTAKPAPGAFLPIGPMADMFVSRDELTWMFATWSDPDSISIAESTRPSLADPWPTPQLLSPSVLPAQFPVMTDDGLTLYVMKNFATDAGDEICVSTRPNRSAAWSVPAPVGAPLNTNADERPLWISSDQLTFIFHAQREPRTSSRQFDLFITTRPTLSAPWREPISFGPGINTAAIEASAWLSDDGQELIFARERDGQLNEADLYVSRRVRTKSSNPAPATGWHGWPADAPAPAIAPFDAEQAQQHQEAWAKYLRVPVEYTNSIGIKFRLIPPGEFLEHVPLSSSVRPHSPIPTGNKEVEAVLCGGGVE